MLFINILQCMGKVPANNKQRIRSSMSTLATEFQFFVHEQIFVA